MDDHKLDDPYEHIVKDLKSTVNKEYLNQTLLKKDARGNYFDLQGNVIKNSEPYYHDLYDDNDLVSKKYGDVQNAKQDIAVNDKANKNAVIHHDGSGNLDMRDHTITGIRSSSQDNSAVTLGDVKAFFLPRDGGRQMSGKLNMGSNTPINVRPFVEEVNINQSGQSIDFSVFHAQRGELKRLINSASAENLPLDGSDSMTGNFNMNNNKVINLSTDQMPTMFSPLPTSGT